MSTSNTSWIRTYLIHKLLLRHVIAGDWKIIGEASPQRKSFPYLSAVVIGLAFVALLFGSIKVYQHFGKPAWMFQFTLSDWCGSCACSYSGWNTGAERYVDWQTKMGMVDWDSLMVWLLKTLHLSHSVIPYVCKFWSLSFTWHGICWPIGKKENLTFLGDANVDVWLILTAHYQMTSNSLIRKSGRWFESKRYSRKYI